MMTFLYGFIWTELLSHDIEVLTDDFDDTELIKLELEYELPVELL
jgi:hypothetical protein